LNILYLCDEYPPCKHGGIGSVTQILARELVNKGHNVTVCGFYPYYRTAFPFEDDNGVMVYRRFYGNSLLLKLSRNDYLGRIINIKASFNSYIGFLNELITRNKIDIVEIPDFNEVFRYSGPLFLAFPDFGIPKVIKIHGSHTSIKHATNSLPIGKNLFEKEKFHIHNAAGILSVSKFAMRVTKEIFNYEKDITIIHNGISISNSLIYKENLNNHDVIYAGSLSKQKGVLSLILAWHKVIEIVPSARLYLYGKGGGKMIESINRMISGKARESIILKGFVNKMLLPEIYSSACCAIFPSYVESFSMAPMESMLVGCPTIYTKRTSGEELISNGINGLLIDPDNIEEIADAIIKMLSNRPFAIKMGRDGACHIKEEFNISAIADKHLSFYGSIIHKQSKI
jgi:glycogen synthase